MRSSINPNCQPGQIGCGPEVTNWFVEELRYWRVKAKGEIAPFDEMICSYTSGAGLARWAATVGIVARYGKAIPYKSIDFNYADQPNRMGLSPSPFITDDTGSEFHGRAYANAANGQGADLAGTHRDPTEVAWNVPGGGGVTLCGTCIERSELGNFMLGYVAQAVGMSEEEVSIGAIAIGGSLRTWDATAIRYGHYYGDARKGSPDDRDVSAGSLCAFLNQQGIGQMVDAYYRGYSPSPYQLNSGFAHYLSVGGWSPSWGSERAINDSTATPVTTGPGIIENNPFYWQRIYTDPSIKSRRIPTQR